MFRFRLSSFLLVIALLAVFLGWLLDHRKLKARNELLNQEAVSYTHLTLPTICSV